MRGLKPPEKVTVCTPCYGGVVDTIYVQGLLQAYGAGLIQNWVVISTESLVPRARNRMAHQFLQSDSDRLVFIDADVGFTGKDLEMLLENNLDIVGGAYPKKSFTKPGWIFGDRLGERGNLLEVKEAGTGFLAIKRKVIAEMSQTVTKIQHDDVEMAELFPIGVDPDTGRYLSEDWYFCMLARRAGFRIWIDRRIRLRHAGRHVFQ